MKLLNHIANHHHKETVEEKGTKYLGKKDAWNEHDEKDKGSLFSEFMPDEL